MTDEEFFGTKLPGVTTILSEVFGADDLSHIPKKILDAATERGTYVHKWIEDYINGKTQGIVPLEYQIYIDYFNEWKDKYKPKFIFSEQKIISHKLGYKGIIDALYEDCDGLIMGDWKTSSNLDVFKALCQLNLYLLLLEEMHPQYVNKIKKLKILSLTKYGFKYYVFDVDRELANAILTIYRKKKQNG